MGGLRGCLRLRGWVRVRVRGGPCNKASITSRDGPSKKGSLMGGLRGCLRLRGWVRVRVRGGPCNKASITSRDGPDKRVEGVG